MNFNFQGAPDPKIPIIGSEEPGFQMLHANVVVTPELLKRLQDWSQRIGIPFGEIGQTIFRMGLIGLSMNIDQAPVTSKEAIECIPLTENEKKIKFN